jgi:hypothetical protein
MFDSFNPDFALLYGLSKRHATGKKLPLKFLCEAVVIRAEVLQTPAQDATGRQYHP